MEDQKIIELYMARDESAIPRTMEKYAELCRNIALGILADTQTTDACLRAVCDTLWSTLPEKGTKDLVTYVAKISRSTALNHWKQLPGPVRKETQVLPVTEELGQYTHPVQEDTPPLDRKALVNDLNQFLSRLDDVSRAIFMGRYWYFHTVQQLAHEHALAPEVIEATLQRSRGLLQQSIGYPVKPGNILSCLGRVSGRYILPPVPTEERPVRRSQKKKRTPMKLIVTGAAVFILIAGLSIAWVCGLFTKDTSGPDGLTDKGSRPAVGLNEDDSSSETVTEYGSIIQIGNSRATVLTAGYDDSQICILVKAIPTSSDVFLIPKDLDRDDSTRDLIGLNDIPEGTVDQYASYLGRTLAKFTVTCNAGGTELDGALEYAFGADGVLYYRFTAPLPEGGTDPLLITASFYQDLEEASDAQTAELAVKLAQLPEAEASDVTAFAAEVSNDTGLPVRSARIEKTGLGYHVTFDIQIDEEKELLFLLTDINGEPLPALPGYATAIVGETADGYRTFQVSCQMPEQSGDLYFTITDQDTGIEYGPYALK